MSDIYIPIWCIAPCIQGNTKNRGLPSVTVCSRANVLCLFFSYFSYFFSISLVLAAFRSDNDESNDKGRDKSSD